MFALAFQPGFRRCRRHRWLVLRIGALRLRAWHEGRRRAVGALGLGSGDGAFPQPCAPVTLCFACLKSIMAIADRQAWESAGQVPNEWSNCRHQLGICPAAAGPCLPM